MGAEATKAIYHCSPSRIDVYEGLLLLRAVIISSISIAVNGHHAGQLLSYGESRARRNSWRPSNYAVGRWNGGSSL